MLVRAFTQNIDTLERVAGISTERLVEAHGSFSEATCIDCGDPFDMAEIEQLIFADSSGTLRFLFSFLVHGNFFVLF